MKERLTRLAAFVAVGLFSAAFTAAVCLPWQPDRCEDRLLVGSCGSAHLAEYDVRQRDGYAVWVRMVCVCDERTPRNTSSQPDASL